MSVSDMTIDNATGPTLSATRDSADNALSCDRLMAASRREIVSSQTTLPDPWHFLLKGSLRAYDLVQLVPVIHLYPYSSLCIVDAALFRLYASCRTTSHHRQADIVANALESNIRGPYQVSVRSVLEELRATR